MKAGRTIAAINNATPPTIVAPFEELVSVAFEAANTLTEEIAITARVAIDFTKLFILFYLIILKMPSIIQYVSQRIKSLESCFGIIFFLYINI